ncbi:MAG TPA: GGDEF domain-containing protein, partial [Trinickia sp.]|nr:GGDEF domain-containing protein [Trinickia sp.]
MQVRKKSLKDAPLHWALALTRFAAVPLACWLIAGFIADRVAEHALSDALAAQWALSSSAADNMGQLIASDLAMARAIPESLAEVRMIQRGLAQARNYAAKRPGGEPALRAQLMKRASLANINAFLHDVQDYSGLENLWLANAQGVCVASSNALARRSFIGVDVSTRSYMTNALMGSVSETYSIGRISGDPGLYIAAPVYDDGTLVGAIVAKVGLERVRHWVASPGAFVADENDVVIVAHERELEGRALPHARVERLSAAQRMDAYHRINFAELDIVPPARRIRGEAPWVPQALAARIMELPGTGGPSLYASRNGSNSGFTAHLADPLVAWPALLRKH